MFGKCWSSAQQESTLICEKCYLHMKVNSGDQSTRKVRGGSLGEQSSSV